MAVGCLHLAVQYILHKVVVRHLTVTIAAWGREFRTLGLVPLGVTMPASKVGSMVSITQQAIQGIGHQPLAVLGKEGAVVLTVHHAPTFLYVYLAQILFLSLHHSLIVYLLQSIELLLLVGVVISPIGICQRRQLAQVGILRMQSKHAYTTIGVAICPCMVNGSIVDGQHLQHALSGRCHKVYHSNQVTKVAYAEASFGT